jgi:magnesium-transporting ATPase (P-type)
MYATLPTAARFGREAFASHLGRVLAGHGAVVLDHGALRRLDRVDTVVVDLPAPRGSRRDAPRWAEAVLRAARGAGLMVVEATPPGTRARLQHDLRVDGGEALVEEVRCLQADGCVVALVAGATVSDALWATDVGVGLWRGTGAVPWAADILVPPGDAWRVPDAVTAAGAVARQSVSICLAGAAAAGAVTFGTARPGRASWAVNGAALLAMATAARTAAALARREPPVGAAPPPPWHAMSPGDVLTAVGSRPEGLTGDEAGARVPPGDRPAPPAVRLLHAVHDELVNPLTPLLLGGAGLSAALGGALDAAIVAGVTAANAVLGGVQRWRTDQAAEALARVGEYRVHVRRDGAPAQRVPAEEVVVGDVLVLRAGDVVPADARVLTADALLIDESTLTGESLPVEKATAAVNAGAVADRRSMLYAGTSVLAGDTTAVVVATGRDTEAGSAAAGVHAPAGGVDARLADLTRKAIPVSLGAGAAVLGLAALRGGGLREGLRSGATLAVAAVPEGLPLVATMAQLASARRLASRGALVRNPRAVEALGRVDVLLTDKTGTLTVGRLEVKTVSDLLADADISELPPSHQGVLAAAVRATPRPEEGMRMAHPTDAAIVRGGGSGGVTEQTGRVGWQRMDELPFEPAQGFHATLGRADDGPVLSVKGAPEAVLPRCTTLCRDGCAAPLGAEERARAEAAVVRLARRGLRILAVAEGASDGPLADASVQGLTLLGLVAIADRARPEAATAVRTIRGGGVSVCMVTGDHPSTAEGIAAELGLLNGHRVVSGTDLASMDDHALDEIVEQVSVFARVTPADKVRITESLHRRGRVVAMTGDGSNDAPAIRLADVGLAIGSRATPAARDAADVIVTDDNIETIIDTVIEGRALWGSVRDALAILLGGNLGEVAFNVAGAAVGGAAPLNPRQLLLVNLLTDVAPALAIATRPPRGRQPADLLAEGPDRSLGAALERAVLVRAAVTTGGTTLAWLMARMTGRAQRASTVALATLVATQLAQTVTTGGTNPVVVGSAVGSAAALVAFVQAPGLSQLCGCTPLGPVAWSQVAIGTGAAVVVSLGLHALAHRPRP